MGHLAQATQLTRIRACLGIFLAVGMSGCIPFAIREESSGALVENRDQVTYLVELQEDGVPVEATRLVWEVPPGPEAWTKSGNGSGRAELVLLTETCQVLDHVALDDRMLDIVIEGATFSNVTDMGVLDYTPPQLQEIEVNCP
jgi:hypothetical protein